MSDLARLVGLVAAVLEKVCRVRTAHPLLPLHLYSGTPVEPPFPNRSVITSVTVQHASQTPLGGRNRIGPESLAGTAWGLPGILRPRYLSVRALPTCTMHQAE
jgi:hypothetical protein